MQKEKLSGIAFMMVGVTAFAGMDALGKWLVRDYSVFQVLALRSTIALALLAAAGPFVPGWSMARTSQRGAHLLRALCGVAAFLFFFTSVRYLPLADAVAVEFGGPFIVTALSVPLLGETVDGRRWLAVVVGFFGMLLIVQPTSASFHPAALLVVAASFCYSLLMILTRWMSRRSGGRERTESFLFYTFAVQAAVGWLGTAGRYAPMGPREWVFTAGVAVLALAGHFGITVAFERAPVSVVAPFEYTALAWATLFGFLMFGDFPTLAVWLGVAVIVAAGLYTIYRERRQETTQ